MGLPRYKNKARVCPRPIRTLLNEGRQQMSSLTKPRLAEMVPYFALRPEVDISNKDKGKKLQYDEDQWEDCDDFSDSPTAIESSAASTIKRKYSSSSDTSTVRPRMSIGEKYQEKG